MNEELLAQIALTFGLLSLFSIGGANATIPEIHRQVVDVLHWMDDATFANLIAIGQTAPGPNVLIVSMIGWHVAGIAGLLVATFAIVLPSSLFALAAGRALRRFARLEWIGPASRALAPIAVGLMLASGYVMSWASYQGAISLLIVVMVTAFIILTRRSPLLAIAGGATLGVVAHRLHLFA